MRTLLFAGALIFAAPIVQAQPSLPPPATTTPNPGNDEVSARRKLEDQGYRDLRNVTPNGDGTFSAEGMRQAPGSTLPHPDVKLDIDSSGNVRER
jgi:hypothetical protein